MKFTKEDAVKELTAKFSQKVEKIDKWERTIRENVENLSALIGDESEIELEEFVNRALPLLDTTAGFLRKENSDLAKGFNDKIEDLKRKFEEDNPKNDRSDKTELELMKEEIASMKSQLESERREKDISEKKSAIIGKIKEKGVNNEDWVNAMIGKISIGDETNVDKEAESFVEMYNKFFSGTPSMKTPKGSGGSESDRLKEMVNAAAEIAKSQRLI